MLWNGNTGFNSAAELMIELGGIGQGGGQTASRGFLLSVGAGSGAFNDSERVHY